MLIKIADRTVHLEGSANETAHVNFFRRSPQANIDSEIRPEDYGYFIELPPRMRVTVNGHTFVNEAGVDHHDNSAPVNRLIIGPLTRYTVVEVLSQPVFFFRSRADLGYTDPKEIVSGNSAVPSDAEQLRRSRYKDVAQANVTVTWTALTKLIGGEDLEGGGSEETPGDTPNQSEEEIEYSDDWTDDGTNPSEYVQSHLIGPYRRQTESLITRIIAAINDRQPSLAGFSIIHEDGVLRSGRTLLIPLTLQETRDILVVVQVQDDLRITLRALDPMAWRSQLEDRNDLYRQIRQILIDQQWWQNVHTSQEDMEGNSPETMDWVPCAQHTASERSTVYTVLNAWTLALGLEPDPAFRADVHANEDFFSLAHRLFQRALDDSLNWKVLVAFLRSTSFVRSSVRVADQIEIREHADPALNRRFDLSKRSFKLLIERQTRADAARRRDTGNEVRLPEVLDVQLEGGIAHTTCFASDRRTDMELRDIGHLVRQGRWNLKDTWKQLQIRRRTTENAGSQTQHFPGVDRGVQTEMAGPKGDTLAIPPDFNHCKYFRSKIQKLKIVASTTGQLDSDADDPENTIAQHELSEVEVYQSIAAVVRALNELATPKHGFTLSNEEQAIISKSRPRDGFQDSIMLRPYQVEGHTILLLFQTDFDIDGQQNTLHVIDSAPWTLTLEDREEMHATLISLDDLTDIVPITMDWVFGPQQTKAWQSAYFTVLNAWSILFGLPLNMSSFSPGDAFFQEAYQLVQAVLAGQADWKLIWAFLRCVNYTTAQEPVADRRFTRTVPGGDVAGHAHRSLARPVTAGQITPSVLYEHFTPESSFAHDMEFPWDTLDEEDRTLRIPALQDAGKFKSSLSRKDFRAAYNKLSGNTEAAEETPCAAFHRSLNAYLQNAAIVKQLEAFRIAEQLYQKFGAWQDDMGVSLAIAAVTLAINDMQVDANVGFGFINSINVQISAVVDEQHATPTIRPGRPMLIPVLLAHHLFLLVIQLDENGELSFSVLDSKASHLNLLYRQYVHNHAWRLVHNSGWAQHLFPASDLQRHKPKYTTWIPVSQQPAENECGYYTILHGWTLALGLLPDPDAVLDWTDAMFNDLQNVIHLARLGHASWQLIHDFLRCHRFVHDGEVPMDRRFERTADLTNDNPEYLGEAVQLIRDKEDIFFLKHERDLDRWNSAYRIPLPAGRRHNETSAFPADGWFGGLAADMGEIVEYLARFGRLDLSHNEAQLRQAYEDLRAVRSQPLIDQIRGTNLIAQARGRDTAAAQQAREEIQELCRRSTANWHAGRSLQIVELSRQTALEALNFYTRLFADADLRNILLPQFRTNFKIGPLHTEEVNLPIAAVIEAIDARQNQLHNEHYPGEVFTGGFSMTSSTAVDLALVMPGQGGVASRPRRCWILPLCPIGTGVLMQANDWRRRRGIPPKKLPAPGENLGHHLLAVVREMPAQIPNKRGVATDFNVIMYDSSPQHFGDASGFLAVCIGRIAKQFGWSKQRNTDEPAVDFRLVERRRVAPPEQGGWQCGYHVIVNAWIVALGLHPRADKTFDAQVYQECHTLARAACAGLLDWASLAAWLVSNKFVDADHVDEVPIDRRFGTTRYWRGEAALQARIAEIRDAEYLVDSLAESLFPYDFSNNVGKAPVKEENQGGSLKRRHDDLDLEFFASERVSGRRRKRMRVDALKFLDGYGVDDGSNSKTQDARRDSWRGGRVEVNALAFLDGY